MMFNATFYLILAATEATIKTIFQRSMQASHSYIRFTCIILVLVLGFFKEREVKLPNTSDMILVDLLANFIKIYHYAVGWDRNLHCTLLNDLKN